MRPVGNPSLRASTHRPAGEPTDASIRFEGVSIASGGRRVLDNVEFSIPPGAFVGVLGPNGAGKTTLMRAMLGLARIPSGRVSVLGAPPRRGNAAIGYLPQARALLAPSLTGFEVLLATLGGRAWGWPMARRGEIRAVQAALAGVGATALARRPVGELSGGERQRLFIAQALIGDPKLLLLDEPLAGLDPGHQHGVLALIAEIARERRIAVLLSAHELNPLLPVIDTVLYLGNGHAAVGTVDQVVRPEVLSGLYGSPVEVIRAGGRIFIAAENGPADGHLHVDAERGAA